jgi:hypothetical protein
MVKIPETFYIGDKTDLRNEELLRLIEQMYYQLAKAINRKPDIFQRTTDGLTTDTFLSNGDININTNTLKVEMLTQHVSQTVVQWTQLS